jgi:class 3 adenylate cyclase
MKWIESLIVYLYPTLLLEGKPWKAMWEEKERESFVKVARFFFFMAAGLYIGHYFFYDRPMNLEPLHQWFWFRVGAALVSLFALVFYVSPLAFARGGKIPAVIAVWVFCYSQAMITTWWDGTPWLFSFVFVIASLYVLRLSPMNTILLSILIMVTQAPFLIAAGVPLSSVISTGLVVLMILFLLKSSHVADVRNFVLNQENISAQKRIIELNIEFSDRLRAFIPKVIANRLETFVQENRLTIIQAAVEVLKPRQVAVACLFSDIRGYTKSSTDLDRFVDKSVLPEMKACSNAVEDYGGIPRKIGDLIFAYFDEISIRENVLRCLLAGMEISKINSDLNETTNERLIRRYILISSGEAVVGNLGGLDSSIEITALGPPVNYLSRLDELTKHFKLSSILVAGDILICSETAREVQCTNIGLGLEEISLEHLGLVVRDFPEAKTVYRVQRSTDNLSRLQKALLNYQTNKSELPARHDVRATGPV